MMHQPEQNPGTNMHQNMHQNALSLLVLIDLELLPAFGCGARIGVGVLRDCPIGLFPFHFISLLGRLRSSAVQAGQNFTSGCGPLTFAIERDSSMHPDSRHKTAPKRTSSGPRSTVGEEPRQEFLRGGPRSRKSTGSTKTSAFIVTNRSSKTSPVAGEFRFR